MNDLFHGKHGVQIEASGVTRECFPCIQCREITGPVVRNIDDTQRRSCLRTSDRIIAGENGQAAGDPDFLQGCLGEDAHGDIF